MNRLFGKLAFWAFILALVSGCQPLTGRTLGQNIDDANVTAVVKSKLVADKTSNLTRIDGDTNGGVFHLNRTVETDADQERAEQIASEVNGVKRVVNNLQVQK
jgi:hyperosmotically inducible protein